MNNAIYYDYSNLCKVYLTTGIATREPLPDFLCGFPPADLADLTSFDLSLGIHDLAWWPAEDGSIPLGEYQSYDLGSETLTSDMGRKVVVVVHPVVDWTPEQIHADIVPKIVSAIFQSNRDTDAFYNTYIGRRSWEQAVADKARAFAAGGYTGDVPAAVSAMMTENGQTAQQAADAIIALFDDQSGVMGQVFAKRDKCQVAMRAATVNAELNPAVAEWTAFLNGLCAQLSINRRYDY
jgi:hypothetical protein